MTPMNEALLGDFGGTKTAYATGGRIHVLNQSFERESEEKLLAFLSSKRPENCPLIVAAVAATLVPGETARRVSPTSTKFTYLAAGGDFNDLEAKWGRRLHCRVVIGHDAEMAARGEIAKGTVTLGENALVCTLGTSIGGALIVGGQLPPVPYSCRLSHLPVDSTGPECPGEKHRGCYKTFAGRDALEELAGNMGFSPDLAGVSALARQGDTEAIRFFTLVAERVARGLAAVASIFPLHAIVIGGGIAGAGDLLLEPIRGRLRQGDLLDAEVAACVDVRQTRCENAVLEGCQDLAQQLLA